MNKIYLMTVVFALFLSGTVSASVVNPVCLDAGGTEKVSYDGSGAETHTCFFPDGSSCLSERVTGNHCPPNSLTAEKIVASKMATITLAGLESHNVVADNETQKYIVNVWGNVPQAEKDKLASFENITIEKVGTKVDFTGMKEARFLGIIKMNRVHRYELKANGSIEVKPKFWDFLWKMR